MTDIADIIKTISPEIWTGAGEKDRSTADLRLMRVLFILCRADAVLMDQVFRQSPLMREKYSERPGYRFNLLREAGGRP